MVCETVNPKWCTSGSEKILTAIEDGTGSIIMKNHEGKREFLTDILEGGNDQLILHELYKETARVVMLVRDRLEREKPIEKELESIIEGEIL